MTLSEAVSKVIELSCAVREYYERELPKYHPNYPIISMNEESAPEPPEESELKNFLTSLTPSLIYQLELIMYLGRGDFGVDDLESNHRRLQMASDSPKRAALDIMQKVPLADYLIDGLEELNQHGIDVDHLPLKRVKLAKKTKV